MEPAEPTGIILDEPYANAVIWRAWKEGLAQHYVGDNPWKTTYSRQLLLRGLGPATTEDALFLILCYGSAWLPPFDNFSIDGLVDEGLARVLPRRYWERYGEKADAMLYKGIVLRQLRKKGVKRTDYELDLLVKWWGMLDAFYSLTGEHDTESIPEDFWRDLGELGIAVPRTKLPRFWGEARLGIFKGGAAAHAHRAVLKFIDMIDEVSSVTTHVRTLERAAVGLGAPVKTNLQSVRMRAIAREHLRAESSDALRVWRIVLSEIDVQPRLHSLADILRLREDRSIRNFRQILQEWSVALCQRGPEEEKKLRKELRSAVRDLRKLGPLKTVGRWITFAGFPVEIALEYFGIPGVGIAISAVGAAIELRQQEKERKYGWLMFGK